MFIGRKAELEFLESKYKSNGGQLIVLYGRRRVGKTETLREFCKDKPHVFYSCRECTDHQQLESFSERVLREDIPAAKYLKSFSDWETALSSIIEFNSTQKKLLIIDEFPYMCKANKCIPSILQNLWDEKLKDENVMIILCGSSMSFIEKDLLAEKNPLYGRATGIYKMKEMSFGDAVKFFPHYTAIDKIIAYSILGGIPHYLKQFDSNLTVEENIKRNILTKGCVLYSEVEFLLRQELRETTVYNTIIEAIALGNTKLNDIYTKTQIEKVKLSVYLKNLIELEVIEREFSVSDSVKEQANSIKGLYKLTDNFFRFWYSFVFPNYSELESGDVDGVYKYIVAPELNEYTSFIFEDVCRQYISVLNRMEKLPFRYYKMGRWWGKITTEDSQGKKKSVETEIDIIAVDRHSANYLLGECKFKDTPFEKSEYITFDEKIKAFEKHAKCWKYLFSKSGFTPAVKEIADINDNIECIDIDELVGTLEIRES